jgi:hypothetical protein
MRAVRLSAAISALLLLASLPGLAATISSEEAPLTLGECRRLRLGFKVNPKKWRGSLG